MQIFTPANLASASGDRFHFFKALPTELRLQIWTHALRRRRIIKVSLFSAHLMHLIIERHAAERPESHSTESYGVILDGYQTVSKLFRVDRESRQVALEFYRIHLPCWVALFDLGRYSSNDPVKASFLYFNPEYDFLSIENVNINFASFLYDLKVVYDPQKIGLLNLATDDSGLFGSGLYGTNLISLEPPVRDSFVETIFQIREVFFIQEQRVGRFVLGYASGASTSEKSVNLAVPVMARPPTFDILGPDPREIGAGLSKFYMNADPCRVITGWHELCKRVTGSDIVSAKMRVLLTVHPFRRDILNLQDAQATLLREEDEWVAEGGKEFNAEVPTAFGFWLFPIDAFGPDSGSHAAYSAPGRDYVDLTGYMPDLALIALPPD